MRLRTLFIALIPLLVAACSPFYITRVSWEEAGILLRREPIRELIELESTQQPLREKLKLVEDVRTYAETLGIAKGESYSTYSEVDRDVLVWVVTAASNRSLDAVTWWYPIVGSVPYKGFFKKESAVEFAKDLQEDGFDVYVRPSLAYSTLGWFDDPLLSTLTALDETYLTNTVIHELLHNTIWVKDHAFFNETMANVVGHLGAHHFFSEQKDAKASLVKKTGFQIVEESAYAEIVELALADLEALYEELKDAPEEEVLKKRTAIFDNLRLRWKERFPDATEDEIARRFSQMNNAALIAQQIYLKNWSEFIELYQVCDRSLPRFISELKKIAERHREIGGDPYKLLQNTTSCG